MYNNKSLLLLLLLLLTEDQSIPIPTPLNFVLLEFLITLFQRGKYILVKISQILWQVVLLSLTKPSRTDYSLKPTIAPIGLRTTGNPSIPFLSTHALTRTTGFNNSEQKHASCNNIVARIKMKFNMKFVPWCEVIEIKPKLGTLWFSLPTRLPMGALSRRPGDHKLELKTIKIHKCGFACRHIATCTDQSFQFQTVK
jgi:hypothetical protein